MCILNTEFHFCIISALSREMCHARILTSRFGYVLTRVQILSSVLNNDIMSSEFKKLLYTINLRKKKKPNKFWTINFG